LFSEFPTNAVLASLNTKESDRTAMSLPEKLVEKSTLTHRQLEALRSYLRVALGEMKYREAAANGMSKSVTIGSYFRTVQQGRENVRRSIVTLLIGVWLGFVKSEDVRRLLDVAGGEIRELSDEENAQLVEVLRVLIDRMVR
jgi:hypothetical protein